MIAALVLGFLFGFLGSMPVAGPTAALVLQSALDDRRRDGLDIAIGAAVAESIYACMAFWGLTAVMTRFPVLVPISRILGAAVLLLVGAHFAFTRASATKPALPRASVDASTRGPRRGRRWLLGFTVTAINPTLLATWTGAITVLHSSGLVSTRGIDSIPFALGVLSGIISWFATLLALVGRFRASVRPTTLDRFVRGTGWLLVALGLTLGFRSIAKLL